MDRNEREREIVRRMVDKNTYRYRRTIETIEKELAYLSERYSNIGNLNAARTMLDLRDKLTEIREKLHVL